MLKLLHFFVMLCVLNACAYRSPYQQPRVEVHPQWSVKDRYIRNTNEKNLPYIAWWQGFHDPMLNQLIQQGLVCNNQLNMSRGHIDAAAGELKKIRFQWIPTLDLMFGYSRNPATGFPGFLAVLIPNYAMNIFEQIKAQKQAKYQLEQIKAEDDTIKLTVISQIAASYFTYQAEVERKHLLQTLANDLRHYAKISKQVYHGGLGTNIDPHQLESQVNLIDGEIEVIERNIVMSRNALHYLVNENPGELKTQRNFMDLNNKQLIPGALPLTVLENRPDLQMAEQELRAANQGIGLAASHLLPAIQLDLIGGAAAGNNRYIAPRVPVYFNDQLIKMPILKMTVLGEIAKARGLNKVAYFNYIDTLQKALRDTTNALSNHDRLTNKLNQTIDAQQNLAKAYHLNERLYKQGIEPYFNMLKTKISLDRINIKRNQDKLQQLVSMVNLYQELAGGYRATSTT
jgi:multidrug efflux system outer membrane protein